MRIHRNKPKQRSGWFSGPFENLYLNVFWDRPSEYIDVPADVVHWPERGREKTEKDIYRQRQLLQQHARFDQDAVFSDVSSTDEDLADSCEDCNQVDMMMMSRHHRSRNGNHDRVYRNIPILQEAVKKPAQPKSR